MAQIGLKLQNHLPFIPLGLAKHFHYCHWDPKLVSIMSLSGPIRGYQSVPMTYKHSIDIPIIS